MYKMIYLARRAATVSREDWPRTWRSHAVFASQFPELESDIAYLRYCNRVEAELPGLSAEHDGVAVVGSETSGAGGGGFTAEDRALIDADELRVFDRPTPEFTWNCTEHVIRDGKLGEAALFRFLPRQPGSTRDDFDLAWDGAHADLASDAIAGLSSVTRYVHNRPLHEPPEQFPFDGIVETWFASVDDAVAAVESGALSAIEDDLAGFCDSGSVVTVLTSVCHRWPKD
jgi:uncharacterized protein (TIGR02118 family)